MKKKFFNKIIARVISFILAVIIFSPFDCIGAITTSERDAISGTTSIAVKEWEMLNSGVSSELNSIWGADDKIFAVGAAGVILESDGRYWWRIDNGLTQTINDIWGVDSLNLFAVGAGGTILQYDGTTWTQMSVSPTGVVFTDTFNSIWGTSANNIYAVGENGIIYHYDGVNWTSITSVTTENLNKIWGIRSSVGVSIYAVGANGTIIHYDGISWQAVTTLSTETFNDIWGSSSSDIFVVGTNGTILHYNGSTWTSMTCPVSEDLKSVWGSSSSDVFIVGTNGTILHYDGISCTLMISSSIDNINGIWGRNEDDVFACGINGNIQHYGYPLISITGKITDGTNGIENVCVHAYSELCWNGTSYHVMTGADGTYEIEIPISKSVYIVADARCSGLNYVDEWYDGVDGNLDCNYATPVLAGASNINFVLDLGGTISGRVTDGVNGVAGVDVRAGSGLCGNTPYFGSFTDINGDYTITGLPLGSGVYVYAQPYYSSDYIAEWYDGIDGTLMCDFAALVPLNSTNINFVLETGGAISGKIMDKAGNPIKDAYIFAYYEQCGGSISYFGHSGSDGTYTVNGIPLGSELYVKVESQGNYVSEWYNKLDGIEDCMQANPVLVGSANIDFYLEAADIISGKITDGTNPIPDVAVVAYVKKCNNGGMQYHGRTDNNGNYEIKGIPAGIQAYIYVNPTWDGKNYVKEWYDGADGTIDCYLATAVLAGSTGIDFILQQGLTISGKVTNGTKGLPNVYVEAGTEKCYAGIRFSGQTDANGNYQIIGIPQGYNLYLFADSTWVGLNYVMEWYDGADGTLDCSLSKSVLAGNAGIDFILAPGGKISGVVTDGANNPISKLWIHAATDKCGSGFGFSAETDSSGMYEILGLPLTYDYFVYVEGNSYGQNYISEWYDGTIDCNSAQVIAPNTSNINFVLEAGFSVSGRVTDENSVGIANVPVNVFKEQCGHNLVYPVMTDADGFYEITGLSSNSIVYIYVDGSVNGLDYVFKWYDGANGTFDCAKAMPVAVGAVNIDFMLEKGGIVSGTIKDTSGNPLSDISVGIFSSKDGVCSGFLYKSIFSDSNGEYKVNGLPLNTDVYILASGHNSGKNYVTSWYGGVSGNIDCNNITSQPVPVGSTNIDFALEKGSSISGVVYKRENSTPIDVGNLQIFAIQGDTCNTTLFFGQAFMEQGSGSYNIIGLPAGTYYLAIKDGDSKYKSLWWNEKGGSILCEKAESFFVEAATSVSGKDFYLYIDTDNDGMSDGWEIKYFGDLSHDGTQDSDNDGVNDLDEFLHRIIPINSDSDGDGYYDGEEIERGSLANDSTSVPVYSGDSYYIDSSNPLLGSGTKDNPWNSICHAFQVVNGGVSGEKYYLYAKGVFQFKDESCSSLIITQDNVFIYGIDGKAVLDGTGVGSIEISSDAENVIIYNMDIGNFDKIYMDIPRFPIIINGDNIKIIDCDIHNISGTPITISGGKNVVIEKCNIFDYSFDVEYSGINISNSTDVKIINNSINHIISLNGKGTAINSNSSISILVEGNRIKGDDYTGIYFVSCSDVNIFNNILNTDGMSASFGDEYGIFVSSSSTVKIMNNTIDKFNTGIEFYLELFSDEIAYNIITGVKTISLHGIYIEGDILPSIRYNNVFNYINNYGGTNLTDLTGITGNISEDPLYEHDLTAYLLNENSPCIDAIPESEGGTVKHDIASMKRPIDGNNDSVLAYDMGAYEIPTTSTYQLTVIPSSGLETDYRAFSIPAHLKKGDTLLSVMENHFGTYDSTLWRVFGWNGTDYIELNDANFDNEIEFYPGVGLWIISRLGQNVDFEGFIPNMDCYVIELNHQWNLFSIPWLNVESEGGIYLGKIGITDGIDIFWLTANQYTNSHVWEYTGSGASSGYVKVEGQSGLLKVGVAYWIKVVNRDGKELKLLIPRDNNGNYFTATSVGISRSAILKVNDDELPPPPPGGSRAIASGKAGCFVNSLNSNNIIILLFYISIGFLAIIYLVLKRYISQLPSPQGSRAVKF
ncbi:MAG: right-handed parallel beta-helix repeat-containing protein [Desulfobacterales bacterium]|nr:right-handed parallel beta-helix repeat-containing protein [Desulfobacterales bacterium]